MDPEIPQQLKVLSMVILGKAGRERGGLLDVNLPFFSIKRNDLSPSDGWKILVVRTTKTNTKTNTNA